MIQNTYLQYVQKTEHINILIYKKFKKTTIFLLKSPEMV